MRRRSSVGYPEYATHSPSATIQFTFDGLPETVRVQPSICGRVKHLFASRTILNMFILLTSLSLLLSMILFTQYVSTTAERRVNIFRGLSYRLMATDNNNSNNNNSDSSLMRIVYWSNRDIWNFGNTTHKRTCGVQGYTCEFTLDLGLYNVSDVAVIDVHRLRFFGGLPRTRLPHQKWAFLMLETPLRQFTNLSSDVDKFNFSITYKRDSDVPLPYGRCELLDARERAAFVPLTNYATGKSRLAAWFVSNCDDTDSLRRRYAEELQRYVDVDVYGKCGTFKCDKSLGDYCQHELLSRRYKFYLSFENSFCSEYITEKLWDIMTLDVVPVVLGGSDYRATLPPKSYIDVRDFSSPRELAKYLRLLDQNDAMYNTYFEWKRTHRCSSYLQEFTCKLCTYVHEKRHIVQRIPDILEYWNTRDCMSPEEFYKYRSII